MTDKLKIELHKYDIEDAELSVITNKDGVIVSRIKYGGRTLILKYFEEEKYRREIEYYSLLKEIGIKTINVLGETEKSILLEDINCSDNYRLAIQEDLKSEKVIISLAKYYKDLHSKGREYFRKNSEVSLYSEIHLITEENIDLVKEKSNYKNSKFWLKLAEIVSSLKQYYIKNKTLTYNDFYYGNLIVSKDEEIAFMFDYNFFGEGLSYFDISNVTCSLNENLKNLFIETYGEIDETEKKINEILSHIISLIIAYKREKFPNWANESLRKLLEGELEQELIGFEIE